MHKSKCPVCGSTHSVKNGKRKGAQLYKCADCGYQFRNSKIPSDSIIWKLYQENKQTVAELAASIGCSESTIKRRLRNINIKWEQPKLSGSGFVHLDVTYWGHSWGVLLALDEKSGSVLYMDFVHNETVADYETAVTSIEERCYKIKGIIIDGKQSLFKAFSKYEIQMCQFHMKQIIKRYLTKNLRFRASRALNSLMDTLYRTQKETFEEGFLKWKETWHDTLERRSLLKNGKTRFTHRRLRSAVHSIDFYLPYLFTYQKETCIGMPNTNNKIEGTFNDLKKNLNNHSGMNEENRKRFICGFFLALIKPLA